MTRGGKPLPVVVVGGGPAGSATALALAHRGIDGVVLLEAAAGEPDASGPAPGAPVGESIPPAATPLLRELGVLAEVDGGSHPRCRGSQSVWGRSEPGFNDFLFDPSGKGYHLDRALFDAQLRRAARAAGVEVRRGVRLTGIEPEGGAYLLRTHGLGGSGAEGARFVVDASGARAAVARRLGVARNVVDTLVSLGGTGPVASGTGPGGHTLLEATEEGWWYAVRLAGNRVFVALTSDPMTIRRGRLSEAGRWGASLLRTRLVAPEVGAEAWAGEGGAVARAAPVAILSAVAGPGWLAVGDAAAAYDPLGSAGITRALGHGIAAGEAIADFLTGGAASALAGYQDRVFADFTDHVMLRHRLYASEGRWPSAPFWSGRRRPARRQKIA